MVVIMAYQTCEVEGSLGELKLLLKEPCYATYGVKGGRTFKCGHVSRDCYVLPASF